MVWFRHADGRVQRLLTELDELGFTLDHMWPDHTPTKTYDSFDSPELLNGPVMLNPTVADWLRPTLGDRVDEVLFEENATR